MVEIRNPYPTFLINLESRPDRLVRANIEASKISAKVTQIVAVDGLAHTERSSGLLTNTQQACFDSHRLAYQHFLLSNASHALILEDDLLVKFPEKLLRTFYHKNVTEFDLIQFGFLRMGLRHRIDLFLVFVENFTFKFISKVGKFLPFENSRFSNRLRIRRQLVGMSEFIQGDIRSGAHCYLISRRLAEFILRINPPYYLPIDSFLGTLQYTDSFRVTRSRKNLVRQSNSPSSIKGKP